MWHPTCAPLLRNTHVAPVSYDLGFSAWLVDSSKSYYVTAKSKQNTLRNKRLLGGIAP